MKNPWIDLPDKPPYVLPMDADGVNSFNSTSNPKHNHYLHLDLLPEPHLGRQDAPIVVLSQNPGVSEQDKSHHHNPAFIKSNRQNLLNQPQDYPLYLLDPRNECPGRKYWHSKFKELIEIFGTKVVSQNILVVELLGYHSKKFGHAKLQVPSQQYAFHLVRAAMDRRAEIVLLRAKKHWFNQIQQLESYELLYPVNSWQNPTVSRRNCPVGFPKLMKILEDR